MPIVPPQPSVVSNHTEESSTPAEEAFHPVNNQSPSPLPNTDPQETDQPSETDDTPNNPPETRIDLSYPQQMAQMQAMMSNMYISQMMMNPWMG